MKWRKRLSNRDQKSKERLWTTFFNMVVTVPAGYVSKEHESCELDKSYRNKKHPPQVWDKVQTIKDYVGC